MVHCLALCLFVLKVAGLHKNFSLNGLNFLLQFISPIYPVLLILDRRGSHICLDVIKLAQENDVHTYVMPPISHITLVTRYQM